MKISTLTELRDLLELLAQHDVGSIELEGLKLTMAPRAPQYELAAVPDAAKPATTGESDEELLYWSAGGN